MRRTVLAAAALAVTLTSCGGSGPTLGEYAGHGEVLLDGLQAQLDDLDRYWGSQPPSLEGARSYWDRRLEVRRQFAAGLRALVPPDEYTQVHASYVDAIDRLTGAEEALAERVAASPTVAAHWEWWNTPEGRAARVADDEVLALCMSAQEYLDATNARAGLAEAAWVPSEMREIVRVDLACATW